MSPTFFARPKPPVSEAERQDYGMARRANTPEALAAFVRRYPASPYADEMLNTIYALLADEFHCDPYDFCLPKPALLNRLAASAKDGRPVYAILVQTEPGDQQRVECVTHFIEIAGAAGRIAAWAPNITATGEGTWRAQVDDLAELIEIPPLGRAEHHWSLFSHPWRDGSVVLNYYGDYGLQRRPMSLHCRVELPG